MRQEGAAVADSPSSMPLRSPNFPQDTHEHSHIPRHRREATRSSATAPTASTAPPGRAPRPHGGGSGTSWRTGWRSSRAGSRRVGQPSSGSSGGSATVSRTVIATASAVGGRLVPVFGRSRTSVVRRRWSSSVVGHRRSLSSLSLLSRCRAVGDGPPWSTARRRALQ